MKIFTGKVIHTKMSKTATVEILRMMAHPVYGKRVKRTKRYHVHDEIGAVAGDMVHFVACKPVSKLKKWKIVEILGKKQKPVKSKKIESQDKSKKSETKGAKK